MKVLIVGKDALALDFCNSLKKDGVDVKWYIQDPEQHEIGEGIINKSEDWEKDKDWADVIVFEDTGFGTRASELKEDGYVIVGGAELCDNLEAKRDFGAQVAKEYMDLLIPKDYEFNDFEEAINFIKENPKRYVVKFNGNAGNIKDLVYCGKIKSGEDVIEILYYYKKIWQKEWGDVSFILQEFIQGIEVGITGYFDGSSWVMPYYIDHEYKYNLAGNVGVLTGQEGEAMRWFEEPTDLFNSTFKKLIPLLKKAGYVGSFNINGIANEDGYHFLEFTPRFGYNSTSIELEFFKHNGYGAKDLLNRLISNEYFEPHPTYSLGVLITIPPYPHRIESIDPSGIPISFLRYVSFHPHEVKQANDILQTAGTLGYIGTVASAGSVFELVQKRVYESINDIVLPRIQYRNDIGDNFITQLEQLEEWGYL